MLEKVNLKNVYTKNNETLKLSIFSFFIQDLTQLKNDK